MSYNTIIYDNKAGWNLASSTSFLQSYTVGSGGNDRLLVVILCARNQEFTALTYAGVSLTLAKKSTTYDGCETSIWYLLNPATGSNNIAGTLDAGRDNTLVGAISFFNIDQGSSINLTDESYANAGSFTNSFTPTLDNCVVVEGQFNTGITSGSISGGQTLIHSRSSNDSGGCSYEMDIDAGTESVGWSGFDSSSTAYSHALVVFKPSSYYEINEQETITISESNSLAPDIRLSNTQLVTVTDDETVRLVSFINKSESILVTDVNYQNIREGRSIHIWKENISVEDEPQMPGEKSLGNQFEDIHVTDEVYIKLSDEGNESYKPYFMVRE
jgi:hypothetical protein